MSGTSIESASASWPPGLFPQSPVMAVVWTEIVCRVHRALTGTLDKGSGSQALDPSLRGCFVQTGGSQFPFWTSEFPHPQVAWFSSQNNSCHFSKACFEVFINLLDFSNKPAPPKEMAGIHHRTRGSARTIGSRDPNKTTVLLPPQRDCHICVVAVSPVPVRCRAC